jgi:hypothetical protein
LGGKEKIRRDKEKVFKSRVSTVYYKGRKRRGGHVKNLRYETRWCG